LFHLGRRDPGLAIRPDGAVRAVRGHEQDPEHQTLPDRKGLQEGQPFHEQRTISRVLPMREFNLLEDNP
jgi:hypothetical protein